MPKYLVLDPDDLLSTSIPVCEYDEGDDAGAIDHAANRKGYVVLEDDEGWQSVAWVSPRFNARLMMETIIRRPYVGGRMMAGRPSTSAALARLRQQAWDRAVRYSGLTQDEIAAEIGMSLATVRSYSAAKGNTPSEEAIAILKRRNLVTALETLAERYGDDVVTVAGRRP